MPEFQRIFLFINREKERVREVGRETALLLTAAGRQVVVAPPTFAFLDLEDVAGVETAEPPAGCDLAVVLGGDGTLLSAGALFSPAGIPMLGVNLGTLGFLSSVTPHGIAEAFRTLFEDGELGIRELAQIEARLDRDGRMVRTATALNDVVVGRAPAAKVNVLDLYLDDRYVDTVIGDGVVVATATGSTAYALSCGGPIVAPGVDSLVVTPISSHTLATRPIVLPGAARITLRVKSGHDQGLLSIDGQEHLPLADGDALFITRSPRTARLVVPPGFDFFETLRRKLGFGAGGRAR